jgi:long-chain acyl-CoA synthetase
MADQLYSKGNDINWDKLPAHIDASGEYDTLPKLLLKNSQEFPDEIAQREKDFGIWIPVNWKQYNDHVSCLALAFNTLGIGKGDCVAILGDNRPEWVWSEIAAHAVRAMSMGIYRDCLEEELIYLINYAEPKLIVAEDEEQIDKLLNLGDKIPSVQKIVYYDDRGMGKYDDPRLIFMPDFEAIGENVLKTQPQKYEELVAATESDDVAILCTTSGTTSNPKLSMWKHKAFIGHACNYLRAEPLYPEDEYLSMLPLSWVMEQMYVIAWNLLSRMTVNFPEEEDTVMSDIREIGPSFLLLSPRVWETIAADIRARMMDASKWKQWIYHWGVKRGMKTIEDGIIDPLANRFLFAALRDRLGFSRLKAAATGGAAMGPDTFKFFQAMGVPLKQVYGQTEAMGVYISHMSNQVDYETVGFPMPECEVFIKDPDKEGLGEVLVKHPYLMTGYFKNEESTQEAFNDDGYFMTGDAGYFDNKGHMIIIDRIKDLAETSKQIRFSPQFIENKLKFSTFVAEAVILGKDRPFLSAIICIRYQILSKWAEQRRIAFTTYSDLAARPEVYDLIRQEVESVNKTLPENQRIQKFILLYKELDSDDGELTRTKKVKRGIIAEKYEDIIETIYSGKSDVDIDTTIHFQDGTSQRIQTTIKVENMLEVDQLEELKVGVN